jgi:hypothetical protein
MSFIDHKGYVFFHNTTPGRYIKLHECSSIYNIVYAKYIQLIYDPVHMTPFTVTRTNPRVNKVEPDEFEYGLKFVRSRVNVA